MSSASGSQQTPSIERAEADKEVCDMFQGGSSPNDDNGRYNIVSDNFIKC